MVVECGLGHSLLPRADWPPAGFCLSGCRAAKVEHLDVFNPASQPLPLHQLIHLPSLLLQFPPFFPSKHELRFVPPTATMFRAAIVRSLRASVPRAVRAPASLSIRSSPVARPSQFSPCFVSQAVRLYSAPAGLSKDEVEGRIVNLLKNFDKVRGQHFARDVDIIRSS